MASELQETLARIVTKSEVLVEKYHVLSAEKERLEKIVAQLQEAKDKNIELQKELEHKAVQPIVDKHQEVLDRIENAELNEDEIRAMFADVGTPIPPEELAEDEKIEQYLLSFVVALTNR